jgi:hypothetical protein
MLSVPALAAVSVESSATADYVTRIAPLTSFNIANSRKHVAIGVDERRFGVTSESECDITRLGEDDR